jgi:hypothetical protein
MKKSIKFYDVDIHLENEISISKVGECIAIKISNKDKWIIVVLDNEDFKRIQEMIYMFPV